MINKMKILSRILRSPPQVQSIASELPHSLDNNIKRTFLTSIPKSNIFRNGALLLGGFIAPSLYYSYIKKPTNSGIDIASHHFVQSKNLILEPVSTYEPSSDLTSTSGQHLTKSTLRREDLIQAEFIGPLSKVVYVGSNVCGHRGIVHGGLLATLLQEATREFVKLEDPSIEVKYSVNYRAPAKAGQPLAILAHPPTDSPQGLTIIAELFDKDGKLLTDITSIFPQHSL